MRPKPLHVLIVEDSEADAALLIRELRRGGYDPVYERVDSAEAMSAALDRRTWDLVLCDYRLPGFSAPAAVAIVTGKGVDVPVIVVSGTVGEETAVEAMRAGAHDFMTKDKLARLAPAIGRELREAAFRAERKKADEEREKMELQMRAAQRMETVGRLAGGVAHDFNNLLTVIQGYARFLHDDFREGDPAREDTDAILNAAERAARLTSQLLAFSRRQVQELRVVNLNEMVAELDKMLRRLIAEDIELVTKLSPDLGRVKVDITQMEQVLMNLVVNARDAMSGGGKLTIETSEAQLEETYGAAKNVEVPPGHYVMLAVTDTGTGMDKETQSQIFEPFFTTKEKSKGTGLGLSTVYGIVKQSGGYIWVYSEPGQGTTFKIYLPLVEEEATREASSRPAADLRGSETILVVEDDEPVRKVAVRILQRHGYQVLEAGNGGDALLLCEQHDGPIHLTLTDIVMPQMSGRELAKRLAAVRPEMRVIFSSGYTDNAVAHHGVLDEGTVFLQKPFSSDALVRKVREILDKG